MDKWVTGEIFKDKLFEACLALASVREREREKKTAKNTSHHLCLHTLNRQNRNSEKVESTKQQRILLRHKNIHLLKMQ